MERKAMQTVTGTVHEGNCCARGKAVLNRLSQIFGVVLGRALLHRASRIALILVLGMAVVLCGTKLGFAQLADSPWPMRGHDTRHTGQSPYKGPQFANLKWKFQTGSDVRTSPAIGSEGTVYVGSDDSYLYALNPDGSLKWKFQTGGCVFSSPAISSEGTVYVGSWDNYLYVLNPDGSLKWKFQTGSGVRSSPAIGSEGTVYVGSDDDYLYALNPDGSLKWKFQTGSVVRSSPAIGSDGTVYVGSWDDHLYVLNPDGSLKWKFQTGSDVSSSPAIGSDGTVYVGSGDTDLYALNPDGSLKWKFQTGSVVRSSPAIGSHGTVYVGSDDSYLYALNPDGSLKWKFKTGSYVRSSPAIGSEGTVYVGSDDSYLYALNPDGSLKWKFKTGSDVRSSPAIGSEGTVYVGSWDDYLYAFGRASGPNVVISETSLHFGLVEIASSKQLTLTISNAGDGPLSVSGITSSSPEFVASPTSFTLAVDESREVTVTFTPSSAEGRLATLTIGSNDPDRQTVTVFLSGNFNPADSPWPMRGHDARHTGQSPYKGPRKPELKWKFQTGYYDVESSPAIGSDGTVYVGSDDHHLYAINPDGSLKWKFHRWGSFSSSPAIGSDSTVYIGSWDTYLYAINPDGNLKWKFQTGDYVWSSPAVGSDGTVYVGSHDTYLYALNPDGSLKWKFKTGYYILSSPAIGSDGTVYVGSDTYLYALNPDGSLKWEFKTAVSSSPAIGSDGTVYVGSGDTHLYALHPDGGLKWRFKTGRDVRSSPAIGSDGTVYVGSDDRHLYAINPDGSLRWKFQTGHYVRSSPAIGSDGTIYVGSDDNNVYALGKSFHPSMVVSEASLHFGLVEIASSKQLTLTISNAGDVPLSVSGITSSSPEFVALPTSFTVPVDSSQEVTVTFTPLSAETKLARLTITSNDAKKPSVTVSLTGNLALANSPWPMRGHDARHTGQSPYKGPEFANLKWKFETGGNVGSCPAIGSDGTVYVGSGDDHLYALNPDGTLKWKFRTMGDVLSSPAIGSDGTVYVGAGDVYGEAGGRYLYALNPDGTLKWKFQTEGNVRSSPAIGLETVYVGSDDGYLYALQPDGNLKWKFETGGWVSSSPAIGSDGTVYVGSQDKHLYALTPDGSLKWKFETGDEVHSSPAIGSDGTVYVGSNDSYLYALQPDGNLKWKSRIWGDVRSSPAIGSDGTVYVGSDDYHLYALSPDGSLKWKFKTRNCVRSSPAIDSDGTVYVGSWDEHLYVLTLDGSLKWKFETGAWVSSSPAIGSDGTVYVGSRDGGIYALGRFSGPAIAFSQTILNYGSVPVGSSKQMTLDVLNLGPAPLSVSSIGSSSPEFVASPVSFTVAVDSSQEVTITFTPLSAETKLATLTITSNDPKKPRVTVSLAGNVTLANSPWPMRGHDAKHTGQSPYIGPGRPELKWKFQTGDNVASSPAIGLDGTVYVGSYDDHLYAVNPDGSLKWKFKTDRSVYSSPAIGSDGTVYVGSADDHLYAFNPDGSLRGKFETGDNVDSSPAIGSDGTVYVGSYDDYLYALHPDASLKWKFQTGQYVRSCPAIGSDGTVYVGSGDQHLYAVNPDGSLKWKFKTEGSVKSSPAIGSDGTVYVGSHDDHLYAFNPDGSLKWKFKTGGGISSCPAIGLEGTVYVWSWDAHLYAVNPDGTLKWKFKTGSTGSSIESSPAIGSDGTVYVGSGSYHHLYALTPYGRPKWTFQTERYVTSSPAIGSDGTVYVGSSDGSVYALGKAPSPNIAISETYPNFGSVEVGSSKGLTLTIFNAGGAPLTVTSISSSSPEFVASPTFFTVPVDSSQEVTLTFAPLSAGSKFAILNITSNDPDRPNVAVSLEGRGNLSPMLYAGRVLPETGHDQTEFVFSVTYADPDNDAPSRITVKIDAEDPKTMTRRQGDDSFINGEVYKYRTKLSLGNHTYLFAASDATIDATGDTVLHSGPTVGENTPPVLSDGTVWPQTGTGGTEFRFTVIYSDLNNDAPAEVTLRIDNDAPQCMSAVRPADGDYADGAVYEYRTKLSAGAHTYRFAAKDWSANATGDTVTHFRPTVVASGSPPLLSNGNVTPQATRSETEFTFEVLYAHADNEPPSEITVKIDEEAKTMVPADPSETNYAEGVLYQYKTTLGLGSHTYSFAAKSGAMVAVGDTVSHTGPLVSATPQEWRGATDQGKSLSFTVSGDGKSILDFQLSVTASLKITITTEWGETTEYYSGTISGTIPQMSVDNNSFSGSITKDVTLETLIGTATGTAKANFWGTFTSPITVEGTFLASYPKTVIRRPAGGFPWVQKLHLLGDGEWSASLPSSIVINEPKDGVLLNSSPVKVSGVAEGALVRSAEINGTPVQLTNGAFSTNVSLVEGGNSIHLIAFDANKNIVGTYSVRVTLDSTPPVVTLTEPTDSLETPDARVTIKGTVDDPSILYVNVNDVPICVAEGQFSTSVFLLTGENNISVKASDQAGNVGSAQTTVVRTTQVAVAESPPSLLPSAFALLQNYPNPFNASTTIRYQLPQAAHAQLSIYNMLGQKVRTLVDGVQSAGFYMVTWDGRNQSGAEVASGIYLYCLTGRDRSFTKKMLLLR